MLKYRKYKHQNLVIYPEKSLRIPFLPFPNEFEVLDRLLRISLTQYWKGIYFLLILLVKILFFEKLLIFAYYTYDSKLFTQV